MEQHRLGDQGEVAINPWLDEVNHTRRGWKREMETDIAESEIGVEDRDLPGQATPKRDS
jgi:hypothetical protein